MPSMQPQIQPLAQSENKSKFLERLGLDNNSDESKTLYSMMKVQGFHFHGADEQRDQH